MISLVIHDHVPGAGADLPSAAVALLRCPSCRAALAQRPSGVACTSCGAAYPAAGGILDLRSPDLDVHKQRQNDFFSGEAEGYERDVVNAPFYQALDALTVERWARQLPPASLVLDIGSGTGRVAIALARLGHRVIAMDLTAPLVERARQKALEAGVAGRITFVLADAEALPIAEGSLDAAVAHGVLHHLEHPEAVIARAGRALRPGGFWFSLDPHRSPARWLFDAAMQWKTLWEEEAAPDGLQTAERLSAWCDQAGIEPEAGYTCYVLPHLVSWLPRGMIERILAATDALANRSMLRRLAGVIVICGRRRPTPITQPSRFPHLPVVAMLVALAALGGTWRADPGVAARSAMYYMGGLEPMLDAARAARRLGVTLITGDGQPLDQQTLDDVGYAFVVQTAAVAGVPVTAGGLARAHAVAFTLAALLFAWAAGARYRSPAAAVAVLLALIVLGNHLPMLIYGQVSNQTATAVFPPLVLAALLVWCARLGGSPSGMRPLAASSLLVGLLAGAIDLVRHSHGLAVILTLALIVAVTVRGVRPRLVVTAALVAGYIAVTMLVPAAAKIQRDVHLDRWQGWRLSYLQRPPAHHISYTLLTAIGRYPNALGIVYEDKSVDGFITGQHPEVRGDTGRAAVARDLFANYVAAHPREYAGILTRGAAELVPFLAYTTFTAPPRWEYAWPAIVPGLSVDPRDIARYGQGLLMNVRPHYLHLRPWQWAILTLALGLVVAAGLEALWRLGRGGAASLVTLPALVYLAWVALPRALIPVQGMDFVFAFWCVALLCGAHVMLSGPRSPLARH
jgi:ubiquinone/menaquinone biosynthesis C-methylase UbiE